MKISELQQREDFGRICAETLTSGWSEQFGFDVSVFSEQSAGAQKWLLQSFLGVAYTESISLDMRKFVANNIRYTSNVWRVLPQYMVGTLLTQKPIMNALGIDFLWVKPSIPHPETTLVAPGNQRIRVFDFESGTTRAFLKKGFENLSMMREIKVRAYNKDQCFMPLSKWDDAGAWIEEPILQGCPLNRCRPGINQARYLESALEKLAFWLLKTAEDKSAPDYVAELQKEIETHIANCGEHYPNLLSVAQVSAALARLSHRAAQLRWLQTARTHGDLQGGNIWVDHRQKHTFLIDWEYSVRRFRYYDFLLMGLSARPMSNFSFYVREYISTGRLKNGLERFVPNEGRAWRKAVVALFLLEELNWVLEDQQYGVYNGLSSNFLKLVNVIAELVEDVA